MTPFRRRQIVAAAVAICVGVLMLPAAGRFAYLLLTWADGDWYLPFYLTAQGAIAAFAVSAALARANRQHLSSATYRLLSLPVWVTGSAYLAVWCLAALSLVAEAFEP